MANIESPVRHWRMNSFRLDPMRYMKNLKDHNPYVGLAHATSSFEVRDKAHDNLLETKAIMSGEINVAEAMEGHE